MMPVTPQFIIQRFQPAIGEQKGVFFVDGTGRLLFRLVEPGTHSTGDYYMYLNDAKQLFGKHTTLPPIGITEYLYPDLNERIALGIQAPALNKELIPFYLA